ncbi:MAG: hypothetical protein M8357_05270 [Desulfobulbaceae bacterium]|nr:hypothetical protein [Desulfobulbaceae bacterium]
MMTRSSILLRWTLVLLVVLGSSYFAANIEVKEDALDLLPDGVATSDLELIRQLGMINRVYISLTIETATPEITDAEWQRLRQSVLATGSLLQESPLLPTVVYRLPAGIEHSLFQELWPLLPVIADEEDYRIFNEAVTEEGVRLRLKRAFQLLNSPAGIGLKDRIVNDPLGLSLVTFDKLKQLRGEFAVTAKDGVFTSDNGKSCLIWADSSQPLTDSQHAFLVQEVLDQALEQGLHQGVTAEVIGTLPHTLANITTVKKDLRLLLPLATLSLISFLVYSFRNARGILVVGIPFLAALPAIVLQNLICGKVSGLALGFGIVLTGLAVDFAVHLYMALSREPGDRETILHNLKRPILLAWCTTTSVFAILLLSSVPSHRQMAVLAIAGISLAVAVSWLLVPTISGRPPNSRTAGETTTLTSSSGRLPIMLWIFLIAAGAACWPWLEFNGDMRVLDATNEQLKSVDNRFHRTWRGSVDQALLLSRGTSLDEALDVNDQVFAYLSRQDIEHFQSVAPILPGPAIREQRFSDWQTFWSRNRDNVAASLNHHGRDLGFRAGSFDPFLDFISTDTSSFNAGAVLRGSIYPLLASMVRFLPDPAGPNNSDRVIVMTVVPENDTTWPVLQKLQEKQIDDLSIISFRTWRQQVEHLLRHDIMLLSLLAGLTVATLVGLFFRNVRAVGAALAPVGSALAGMSLFSFVTGQDINIMHILMGIMVIGLCVDYGIFSVCAHEKGTSRTTRKAVSICAVSSCIGFGVLAFADHPALYSLGTTVLVGIGVAWPTAVWVTPALLKTGETLP